MDCIPNWSQKQHLDSDSFADELLRGLSENPKRIACKYFYDHRGSQLFDEICELPEYYQTRTETALLERHAVEIAAFMGTNLEIMEFGAGSLRKIRLLLDAARPVAYSPFDISGDYLASTVQNLAAEYPTLTVRPIVGDFSQAQDVPQLPNSPRRVGFFPGGTIGNFRSDDAQRLLQNMRHILNGGGLLIGVDLIKDPARIHAAYNDPTGVTAAFNKNLLDRANQALGADFDLANFAHYAPYNVDQHRIEMYLVSLKRQSVTIHGQRFEFGIGEAVHTEDSHKYTIEGFRKIAIQAGFVPRAVWTDDDSLFSIHWLAAP